MQPEDLQDEAGVVKPTLPTEASVIEQSNQPPLESKLFQAIACVVGRYVASENNPTRGTLTTPDGVEFAAFLGRINLRKKLIENYGPIEPGQAFPEQPLVWVAYPKWMQGNLVLTLIGVRSERHFLAPEQLIVKGALIRRTDDRFCLRVYRNGGRFLPEQVTQYSDLELQGKVSEQSQLGGSYRVLAHRAGVEFVVDQMEPIDIGYPSQVKKAIAQVLKPRAPLPPPIKAKQPDKAKLDAVAAVADSIEPASPTEVAKAAHISPDRADIEPLSMEVLDHTTPAEPVAAPQVKKAPSQRKPADSPVIVPTLPEPVQAPQPEPHPLAVSNSPTPATHTAIEPPAVPAAKSKQKKQKQASNPTPVATVPAGKQPEATAPPQPNFVVQVDRRQFSGMTSVTLKTGMLFIDGKQVTQTKLAIVVGEAPQISADGKVQKSGNRTILSSR